MTDRTSAAPGAKPTSEQAKPDRPTVAKSPPGRPAEHGGPKGPEPTRYGDWEKNGRCIDF
jgi:hypothetical protein